MFLCVFFNINNNCIQLCKVSIGFVKTNKIVAEGNETKLAYSRSYTYIKRIIYVMNGLAATTCVIDAWSWEGTGNGKLQLIIM